MCVRAHSLARTQFERREAALSERDRRADGAGEREQRDRPSDDLPPAAVAARSGRQRKSNRARELMLVARGSVGTARRCHFV